MILLTRFSKPSLCLVILCLLFILAPEESQSLICRIAVSSWYTVYGTACTDTVMVILQQDGFLCLLSLAINFVIELSKSL